MYEKGFLQEEPATFLGRISSTTDFAGASEADWVIEAIPENEALKIDLFMELEKRVPSQTPLATNTSFIPISHITSHQDHPERMLGLHFFGPAPFMGLVEVVKGQKTADNIFKKGVDFVVSLDKTPVRVSRDIPGFVMNRIFSAAFRETVDLVDNGIVRPQDVDAGMRLEYGWNVGPFEVADNAGIETFALVGQSVLELGEEHLVSKSDPFSQ